MMHLVLVIAIVIILAASCLLTFALCRAATRRDEMEERWASAASCGQEKEERHEMLDVPVPSIPVLRARLDSIRSGGAS